MKTSELPVAVSFNQLTDHAVILQPNVDSPTGYTLRKLPFTYLYDALAASNVIDIKTVSITSQLTNSGGNGAWADITGLSITKALNSAANRLLISYSLQCGSSGASTNLVGIRVLQDSTPILIGATASGRIQLSSVASPATEDSMATTGIQSSFLAGDTTSYVYKLQFCVVTGGSGSAYINRSGNDSSGGYGLRPISSFTIMELGA